MFLTPPAALFPSQQQQKHIVHPVSGVPNFQPVINAIICERKTSFSVCHIKAIVTLTVRHPRKRDNASHVLFSSLCPVKFGWKADYIGHRLCSTRWLVTVETTGRVQRCGWVTGNDIEKGSEILTHPQNDLTNRIKKSTILLGRYNRILPDFTRQ